MRIRVGIALTMALLVPSAAAVNAQGAQGTQTAPAPILKKSAPPIKGEAEIGYVLAQKLDGNTVVTTFQIKNMSPTGSIVGLQITEYWYDKGGTPLQGTGDRQRVRLPIQPNEVVTVTLKSPKVIGMTTPQYKFEHQNGTIKPTKLKTLK
jgi:uncharacterized protein YcfL